MGIARKVTVGVISLLGLLVVGGGGFYVWASSAARARLAVTHSVHRVDFPIPFPLAEPELAALRAERSAIGHPLPTSPRCGGVRARVPDHNRVTGGHPVQ